MPAKSNVVDLDLFRVSADQLGPPPIEFDFETTAEVTPLANDVFIGQPRVEMAIRKGLGTPGHIFVAGANSINTALLGDIEKERNLLKREAGICDIVCVHNFDNPDRPKFIELKKGQAPKLRRDMKRFFQELKEKILERLSGKEFVELERVLRERSEKEVRERLANLESDLAKNSIDIDGLGKVNFTFSMGPPQVGINVFPVVLEGDAQEKRQVTPEEYSEKSLDEVVSEIRESAVAKVNEGMRDIQKINQSCNEEVVELERSIVQALFEEKITKIADEYGERISEFISELHEYTLDHIKDFLDGGHPPGPMMFQVQSDPFVPFEINVFVDNSNKTDTPVIVHRNVEYSRLFGEVDYAIGVGGIPVGGHMDVHSGLISEANHGVLVLSALDVFTKPGIWEKLRAVLETKKLDIGRANAFIFGNGNIIPETLHIDVKLVLVGSHHIYNLISGSDSEGQFDEIFKTVAKFDDEVLKSEEVVGQFASLVSQFCERDCLPPVSGGGVAECLKHLSRISGKQNKFSLDARLIKDVLNEAALFALQESGPESEDPVITEENIRQAINDRLYRANIVEEKFNEMIESGSLLLSVDGSKVGEINGLAVYDMGDFVFGRPTRITCNVFAGRSGFVSIDREAKLSGPTHNKGIFTVSGYLGEKYGTKMPLSLSSTISFEQNYSGVDGDSATATKVFLILSSLSDVPLRQDIAVTGSMNQKGEIQPIGGVTYKIEGFFDTCKILGFTGNQGVIIPYQNVKDLILRPDVIEAVEKKEFHIYAISHVDEGMEILTGKKMGEKIKSGDSKGNYKGGTINRLVLDRLYELNRAAGPPR